MAGSVGVVILNVTRTGLGFGLNDSRIADLLHSFVPYCIVFLSVVCVCVCSEWGGGNLSYSEEGGGGPPLSQTNKIYHPFLPSYP